MKFKFLLFLLPLLFVTTNVWGQSCGTVTWTGSGTGNFQGCDGDVYGFDSNGDYVVSSVVTNPDKLTFSKKRSNNNSTRTMTVQVSNNPTHTSWTNVTTLSFPTVCTEQVIDLSQYTGDRKIRFIDGAGDSRQRGISNISITCGASGKTVTFLPNGGTGTMNPQTSSTPANLTANTFTRTGHTFANWHTTASGTGGTTYTNNQNYNFSADLTLHAQWSVNQYNIIYNGNVNDGGTVPNIQSGNYNSTITLANNTGGLTKTGFAFSGWNTQANGNGTHYNPGANFTVPATNTTLYAEWVSTAPAINTTGSITAMNTTYGTASTSRNFSFNALNLSGTDVTVSAPAGFEVSATSGGAYSTSLTYPIAGGNASGTVYIRIVANTNVGTHSGNITFSDGTTNASVSVPNSTVTPRSLTITGLSGTNKIYDGNTSATLSGTATLNGILFSDDVTLVSATSITFNNKNAGNGKPITVNYSLTGTKAANYTVTQPNLSGNITPKPLTISTPSIASKVYDGSNVTGAITPGTLSGLVGTETLTVTATGTYADPNVGTGKTATVTYILGNGTNGGVALNYSLANGTGTGNITKVNPVFTTSTINLSVGGTYTLSGANITSTSNGAFSYTLTTGGNATLSGTTLTGVSAGAETLTVSQAATTNYNAGSATVTVNVTAFTYQNGDVRPLFAGTDLSYGGTSPYHWEEYNGGWSNRASSPQAVKPTGRIIIDKADIGGGGNTIHTYLNDIIILDGGSLNFKDLQPDYDYDSWPYLLNSGKGIIIKEGGKLTVEGDIRFRANNMLTVEESGELILANEYMGNDHPIFGGIENFMNGSTVTITDWDWDTNSSYRTIIQWNTNPDINNNAAGYKFGNLVLDVNPTAEWTLIGSSNFENLKFTQNNLEIYNISSNYITVTSNNTSSFEIGGDLIIYDGAFYFGTTFSGSTAFTNNYVINGNLINMSDDNFKLHHIVAGSSTPAGSVTVKGNMEIGKDVIISNQGNKKFILETGIEEEPRFIDIATNVVNTNIEIKDGYRRLKKDLILGTNTRVTVKNSSTLDFGFDNNNSGTTPIVIRRFNDNATQTGQAFTLENGGTLKITSPNGITNQGTYTGNVQVGASAANRVYNGNATFHYIGKTHQATGNGLPDGIAGKVIVDLETDATEENLDFTSSGNTKFNNSGILEIRKGKVIDLPNNGFRNNVAENEDGESDAQKGNIVMTGGRYVVSGSGTKPSLSGNYTISAGTIEFAGTAATKIRTSVPAKQYWNIDVSGTNVSAGGKNLIVNNLTKVVGTGKLTIPESTDAETPYHLTARKGIQVAAGAIALFENNANLMQDPGAVNTGNITQLRKAVVPSNQYNFWTSPVKNQVLYSLYPGIASGKVMVYNTATDYFNGLPIGSNPTSAFGKGYSIKGSNQTTHAPNVTASFAGIPQNESLTSTENVIPLSNVGQRFNLIGNPFPSNLDVKLLNDHISNSGKIQNSTFYFWDNTDNTATTQQGSSYVNLNYANYNASSDVGTAAPRFGTSGKKPNGIVKPGQGFIVQATSGTSGIIVENSMRTTAIKQSGDTENAVYFKNGNNGAVDDIYGSRPRNDKFWLEMVNPVGMHVQIAVGYFKQAENTFETFDSKILSEGVSDNLYSLSKDAYKLSIQGRQGPFEDTDVIPLGVKFFINGQYKIQLEETLGIFKAHQNIYLKDKHLNKIHNLSESPYDFESGAGSYEDRFEIIFKDGNNVTDPVLSTASDNYVKIIKKDRQIEITSSKDKILEVEIFNLSGWSVYKNEKVNSKNLNIPASLFGKQIVVVKVQTETGEIVTKKIINK